MSLGVAPQGRAWMNHTAEAFANRCLPMRIANQAGWLIINDRTVRARWSGNAGADSLVVDCDGADEPAAVSHFGYGILTFRIPFLFRTPPGVALLLRGPANLPKDAIAPLEAIVECDWSIAPASMNWTFTRPNVWVEFAIDEPIAMIVPQSLAALEAVHPRIVPLADDPATAAAYRVWNDRCRAFGEALRAGEPDAVRAGWQRSYFQGTVPQEHGPPVAVAGDHRRRINLRPFAGEPAGVANVTGESREAADQRRREHRSPTLAAMDGCPPTSRTQRTHDHDYREMREAP
jgi:hypothetical protein